MNRKKTIEICMKIILFNFTTNKRNKLNVPVELQNKIHIKRMSDYDYIRVAHGRAIINIK